METMNKVCLEKRMRRNYTIKIAVVGTISLAGLILAVYSLFTAKYLFAVWYFVAFLLGLSYVVIRINAVFPTYIAVSGDRLVMSVWENGVMPYRLPEKPTIFSDFMPEKIKTDEIDLDQIDSIYIGSKKYMNRFLSEEDCPKILDRLSKDKHLEKIVKRMDFFVVVAKDGETCFMSVTDFDIKELANLVEEIERRCTGLKFYTSVPKLRRIREKMKRP